jgi:hypothetical protein
MLHLEEGFPDVAWENLFQFQVTGVWKHFMVDIYRSPTLTSVVEKI